MTSANNDKTPQFVMKLMTIHRNSSLVHHRINKQALNIHTRTSFSAAVGEAARVSGGSKTSVSTESVFAASFLLENNKNTKS